MQKSMEQNLLKTLLDWCKQMTLGYPNVSVANFTSSWRNGLAFCALMHRYNPALIDFASLSKDNVLENNRLAFEAGETLGVPALLDPEDMIVMPIPDKISVVTYLSTVYCRLKDRKPTGGPHVVAKNAPRRPSICPTRRQSKVVLQKDGVTEVMDICEHCKQRVHLIERYWIGPHLYHRNCYVQNAAALSRMSISQDGTFLPLAGTMATPGESELRLDAMRRNSSLLNEGAGAKRGTLTPALKPIAESKPIQETTEEPLRLKFKAPEIPAPPPPVSQPPPRPVFSAPSYSSTSTAYTVRTPAPEPSRTTIRPTVTQPSYESGLRVTLPQDAAPMTITARPATTPVQKDDSVQSGDVSSFAKSDSFKRKTRAVEMASQFEHQNTTTPRPMVTQPIQKLPPTMNATTAVASTVNKTDNPLPVVVAKSSTTSTGPLMVTVPKSVSASSSSLATSTQTASPAPSSDISSATTSSEKKEKKHKHKDKDKEKEHKSKKDKSEETEEERQLRRQARRERKEREKAEKKERGEDSASVAGSEDGSTKEHKKHKHKHSKDKDGKKEKKEKKDKKDKEKHKSSDASSLTPSTAASSPALPAISSTTPSRSNSSTSSTTSGVVSSTSNKTSPSPSVISSSTAASSKSGGNDLLSTPSSLTSSPVVEVKKPVQVIQKMPAGSSSLPPPGQSSFNKSLPLATPPPTIAPAPTPVLVPTSTSSPSTSLTSSPAAPRKMRLAGTRARGSSFNSNEIADSTNTNSMSSTLPAPQQLHEKVASMESRDSTDSLRKVHFNETVSMVRIVRKESDVSQRSGRSTETSSEDDGGADFPDGPEIVKNSEVDLEDDFPPPVKAKPLPAANIKVEVMEEKWASTSEDEPESEEEEDNPFMTELAPKKKLIKLPKPVIVDDDDMFGDDVVRRLSDEDVDEEDLEAMQQRLLSFAAKFEQTAPSKPPKSILKTGGPLPPPSSKPINVGREPGPRRTEHRFADDDMDDSEPPFAPPKARDSIAPLPRSAQKTADVNPFADDDEPPKSPKKPARMVTRKEDDNPFAEEKEEENDANPFASESLKSTRKVTENPFGEEVSSKATKVVDNPFGEEVAPKKTKPASKVVDNPFGDDVEDEIAPKTTKPASKVVDNPFGDEVEEEADANPFADVSSTKATKKVSPADNPFGKEDLVDDNPFGGAEEDNPFGEEDDGGNPFGSDDPVASKPAKTSAKTENPFGDGAEEDDGANPFGGEVKRKANFAPKPAVKRQENPFGGGADENSEPGGGDGSDNPFASEPTVKRKANFGSGVKKVVPKPKKIMSDDETLEDESEKKASPPGSPAQTRQSSATGQPLKTVRIGASDLETKRQEASDEIDRARADEFEVDLKLESVRQRLENLERQGAELEDRMRSDTSDNMQAMSEFVLVVNERDKLVSEEFQLLMQKELRELESRQKVVEYQLRELIDKQEKMPPKARASLASIRNSLEAEWNQLLQEKNQKTVLLQEARMREREQTQSIETLLSPSEPSANQRMSESSSGLALTLKKLIGRSSTSN